MTNNAGAALKTDGTLWLWGSNSYGSLANNTYDTGTVSPIQVPGTWNDLRGTNSFVRGIQLLEE